MDKRAPMDDHQLALTVREHLGCATNAEAYDALLAVCETARKRDEPEQPEQPAQ